MFQIGDMVCYPMHGVGVVEAIEERSVLDEKAQYYILRFVMGRMSAMIPVASAESVTAPAPRFDAGTLPLAEALARFDAEVIRAALPDTPPPARLLRADMLAALLEHLPTHEDDFLTSIPLYLRAATAPEELAWLERVFALIDRSLDGEMVHVTEA